MISAGVALSVAWSGRVLISQDPVSVSAQQALNRVWFNI